MEPMLKSLQLAKSYFHQGNYGKAFSMYLMTKVGLSEVQSSLPTSDRGSVGRIAPQDVDTEFMRCAYLWFSTLIDNDRVNELLSCLETAVSVCSNDNLEGELLNDAGVLLFGNEYYYEASKVFEAAVKGRPAYLDAVENRDQTYNHLIQRWHFRMLNDIARNHAYFTAISKASTKFNNSTTNILDIGSGTGILSMFCASVNPSIKIYGCEASRVLCDISKHVLAENTMDHRICILNKSSTELQVGRDIAQRVNVVVTEIFDGGLLGEGAIPTLLDALERLVDDSREDANFNEPDILCTTVSACTQDDKTQRLDTHTKKGSSNDENCKMFGGSYPCLETAVHESHVLVIPQKAVVYAALIECKEIALHSYLEKNVYGLLLDGLMVHGVKDPFETEAQPYTTEFMQNIRGQFKYLSRPYIICEFHLGDYWDLKNKMNQSAKQTFMVMHDGRIDAIMVWFELHLFEDVKLDSLSATSCWEQAVYDVGMELKKSSDLCDLNTGDMVSVSVTCKERYLDVRVREIIRNEMSACHLEGSVDRINDESSISSSKECKDKQLLHYTEITLDRRQLRKLNDVAYHAKYMEAVKNVVMDSSQLVHLLCLCGPFEILPAMILNSGISGQVSVLGATKEEVYFNKKICETNDIDVSRLKCLEQSLLQVIESECMESMDIVVFELIDPNGLLKEGIFNDLDLIRNFLLKSNGCLIPCGFSLHGMLVSSEFLRRNTSVISDERTFGFKVKEYMNKYQVSTFPDIDLVAMDYTRMSEEFQLFSFDFTTAMTKAFSQGEATYQATTNVTLTQEGNVTALVYWYTIHLTPKLSISTQADPQSHWHQAAVVWKDDIFVQAGDELDIVITLHGINIHAEIRP